MEVKSTNFWWLKNKPSTTEGEPDKTVYIGGEYNVSTNSLVDLFEKEAESLKEKGETNVDIDVGSIIEEINRVAAQSPLGPYQTKIGERSVDELMKEAERIYMESSKSFEQLSQRSKTSQNISEISLSDDSTPTPKSASPLPLDPECNTNQKKIHETVDRESYSEDFSEDSRISSIDSTPSAENNVAVPSETNNKSEHISVKTVGKIDESSSLVKPQVVSNGGNNDSVPSARLIQSRSDTNFNNMGNNGQVDDQLSFERKKRVIEMKQMALKDNLIKALEEDNFKLKKDIEDIQAQLEKTHEVLQETRSAAKSKTSEYQLERALDELKDSKEINTALQLQLDSLSQNHVLLKSSQDDLLNHNRNLERRLTDIDTSLSKYKHELLNVQRHRDKLLDVEISLNKLLDIEKIQTKSLKSQNEADARCIQDLNRQIKEMERIIARKHPDSVSALIMAAKGDATNSNLSARKLLEDRIKTLEEELVSKEKQSSQVFTDIQDKFNQMKAKYEHHIEDLELHVNDLKTQLKKKKDCFDVYTQTTSKSLQAQEIPEKESTTVSTQTDVVPVKPPKVIAVKANTKVTEGKSESHLLATIRGLQSDFSNKEKVVLKMQREIDELKRTNKRLQKEREGSLKSINEKKEFKSYPEKLSVRTKSPSESNVDEISKEDVVGLDKSDFAKIKQQLCRIEMDYQNLKMKRIHDLNALQEAHEREIAQYIQNLQPLREQLELQQLSINTLQAQLVSTKEELAIVTVERDHLNDQMSNVDNTVICNRKIISETNVECLQRKLSAVEKRYEEREHRLRAIVNGLAQKNVMNRNCEQCSERQQQLIAYKMELDQLLASLRALK